MGGKGVDRALDLGEGNVETGVGFNEGGGAAGGIGGDGGGDVKKCVGGEGNGLLLVIEGGVGAAETASRVNLE